jgi:hypothetical protein
MVEAFWEMDRANLSSCIFSFSHGSIRERGPIGSAKRFSLSKLKDGLETARIALACENLRWVVGKFKV